MLQQVHVKMDCYNYNQLFWLRAACGLFILFSTELSIKVFLSSENIIYGVMTLYL